MKKNKLTYPITLNLLIIFTALIFTSNAYCAKKPSLQGTISKAQGLYEKMSAFEISYEQHLLMKEPLLDASSSQGSLLFKNPKKFRMNEDSTKKSYGSNGQKAWTLDQKTGWVNQIPLSPINELLVSFFDFKALSKQYKMSLGQAFEMEIVKPWLKDFEKQATLQKNNVTWVSLVPLNVTATPGANGQANPEAILDKILIAITKDSSISQMIFKIANGNITIYNFKSPTAKTLEDNLFDPPTTTPKAPEKTQEKK